MSIESLVLSKLVLGSYVILQLQLLFFFYYCSLILDLCNQCAFVLCFILFSDMFYCSYHSGLDTVMLQIDKIC